MATEIYWKTRNLPKHLQTWSVKSFIRLVMKICKLFYNIQLNIHYWPFIWGLHQDWLPVCDVSKLTVPYVAQLVAPVNSIDIAGLSDTDSFSYFSKCQTSLVPNQSPSHHPSLSGDSQQTHDLWLLICCLWRRLCSCECSCDALHFLSMFLNSHSQRSSHISDVRWSQFYMVFCTRLSPFLHLPFVFWMHSYIS